MASVAVVAGVSGPASRLSNWTCQSASTSARKSARAPVAAVPFGGIGAGLAIAFLLGQLRPTVENRRQLRELTNYPLLGMVTKTETDKMRRKQRRNNLLFVTGSSAMLVALLAQLIYYLVLSPAA